MKIATDALLWSRSKPVKGAIRSHADAFRAAEPPPGVLPRGVKPMAMDNVPSFIGSGWAGNQLANVAFAEGYTFLGYAYLSELAQIPEYRLISEVISTEATRKWIKVQTTSEDVDKEEKIKQLEAELDRLDVRTVFRTVSEQDGWFGRSHIYIDTGSTDDAKELATPIGDGTSDFTSTKFEKGFLKQLKVIEPIWTYPSNYNASDPMKNDWYRPTAWYVMRRSVHWSRLLTFVSKPVPDMLKPAFSFGGLSMTQMAKPYVDNWLETRQSVNDLIQAFSQMILSTDMSTVLQGSSDQDLMARVDLFNATRNNRGTMVLNKDTEELKNIAVPLGTLDKLQAQAQEHICSVSRIPLVKYTGLSPSGLNASSDGEIRSFYDTIHAYQEKFFDPHLWTIFRFAQINLWGEVDPELTFEWEPLWEMDEVQLATKRKTEADTDGVYIDKGILAPEECRQRIAADPSQPYGPIDVNAVPTPDEPLPENVKEEEKIEEGPEGEGGEAGGESEKEGGQEDEEGKEVEAA